MSLPEIVYSGQLLLALPIALLAGIVSFASPCILPLVPGYLGYLGGLSGEDNNNRRRLLLGTLLFILGFSAIFIAYGAAFGALGVWLMQWGDIIVRIAGVVLIVMGLIFAGWLLVFQGDRRFRLKPRGGLVSAPLFGLAFGLGWTPCIGPVLVAIQALSLETGSPWRGALLGVFYCIGLGLPFLLVAWGMSWATRSVNFLRKHIRLINIIGGLLLIIIGLLMVTGVWSELIFQLQAVIDSFVPAI
ncbi:MAG: cytochrome c biogenesis CcdA family protein [Microbacteriaceae bacterium]